MAITGELALIQTIRRRAGNSPRGALRLGIGDDCAVLRPPSGHDVLVTTDFSLEGRHFRRDWHTATSAGHRCLARGLSDLAAMGARPMAAFLSLALPQGTSSTAAGRRWVREFMQGLLALAEATSTPLAGGDTATAPDDAILADIVLLGSAPRGSEIRRSGARPGDRLYVTGSLGGSAAELELLARGPAQFAKANATAEHPHLFPQPRLQTGDRLRKLASAAIDISDGISTDLRHLCQESKVDAVVDAAALPLHLLLHGRAPKDALGLALHGGEDYELLFTARKGVRIPARIGGLAVTEIGAITEPIRKPGKVHLLHNGRRKPLRAGGWEHTL